jgi:hypothetical protein
MNEDIRLVGIENVEPYKTDVSTTLYNIEPPPMLIDPVLPKGTITALTAASGVGKTWFALEMCRAVLTGGRFMGAFQSEPGSVLFVGSDSSKHDYAQQWRRLTMRDWASFNPTEEELMQGRVEDPNPFDDNIRFLIQSTFMLDNLDTIRKLVRTCHSMEWGPEYADDKGVLVRRKGVSLIVFDTFSKLTRGNQNDNTLTEECFRNIRFVTEQTGAAVLILHHNGRIGEFNDGEEWRGATSAPAALDNRIQINQMKNEKHIIEVKFKKFRGITPAAFHYEMNVDDAVEASLVFCQPPTEKVETVNDSLTDDIVAWLGAAARGQLISVNQIATALHPTLSALFPSEKALRNAIRLRLETELRKVKPRVSKEPQPGGRVLYMALTQEPVDAVV